MPQEYLANIACFLKAQRGYAHGGAPLDLSQKTHDVTNINLALTFKILGLNSKVSSKNPSVSNKCVLNNCKLLLIRTCQAEGRGGSGADASVERQLQPAAS